MPVTTQALVAAGRYLAQKAKTEHEFPTCIRMLRLPRYTDQLLDHTCNALDAARARRLREQMAWFRSEATAEDAIAYWASQAILGETDA